MQFSGSTVIAAPRQATWDFLTDFKAVASCGPGVESLEVLDPRHATVTAKVGVGLISARFHVDLEMAELGPLDRAVIRAEGEAPGTQAEARGTMRLSGPPEGPTTMAWEAEVEIRGALAGVGSRMIEGTAGRMVEQVFDCFRTKLER
jgi:carbon monoxide dehydrogenase subunit G